MGIQKVIKLTIKFNLNSFRTNFMIFEKNIGCGMIQRYLIKLKCKLKKMKAQLITNYFSFYEQILF